METVLRLVNVTVVDKSKAKNVSIGLRKPLKAQNFYIAPEANKLLCCSKTAYSKEVTNLIQNDEDAVAHVNTTLKNSSVLEFTRVFKEVLSNQHFYTDGLQDRIQRVCEGEDLELMMLASKQSTSHTFDGTKLDTGVLQLIIKDIFNLSKHKSKDQQLFMNAETYLQADRIRILTDDEEIKTLEQFISVDKTIKDKIEGCGYQAYKYTFRFVVNNETINTLNITSIQTIEQFEMYVSFNLSNTLLICQIPPVSQQGFEKFLHVAAFVSDLSKDEQRIEQCGVLMEFQTLLNQKNLQNFGRVRELYDQIYNSGEIVYCQFKKGLLRQQYFQKILTLFEQNKDFIITLQKEMQIQGKQIEQLFDSNDKLEHELSQKTQENTLNVQEQIILNDQVQKLQQELQETVREMEQAKSHYDQSKIKITEDLDKRDHQILALQKKIESEFDKNKQQYDRNKYLEHQLQNVLVKLNHFQDLSKNYYEELEFLKQSHDQENKQNYEVLHELENDNQELNQDNNRLRDQNTQLQNKNKNYKSENERFRDEINILEKIINKQKKQDLEEIEKIEEKTNLKLQKKQKKIEKLENSFKEYQTQIYNLEKQLKEYENKFDQQNAKISELQVFIQEQTNAIVNKNKILENQIKQYKQLQQQNLGLVDENENYQKQLDIINYELQMERQSIHETECNLQQIQKKNSENENLLKRQIQNLNHENQQLQEKLSTLQNLEKRNKFENKNNIDYFEKNMNTIVQQLNRKNEDNNNLQNQIQQILKEKNEIQQNLEYSSRQNNQIRNDTVQAYQLCSKVENELAEQQQFSLQKVVQKISQNLNNIKNNFD